MGDEAGLPFNPRRPPHAGSVFWPAANMINVMFCPPAARVLYVNCAGLIWNAILSAFNSQATALRSRQL